MKFRNSVRRALLSVKLSIDTAKWRFTKARTPNYFEYVVEMLVVIDQKYSELAKIACLSFLHHHPNAKILINCDLKNATILRNLLNREIVRGCIALNVINLRDKSWQQEKLELILRMSGTFKIFMDADLKWNGQLGNINKPKVFTIEFAFREKSPFRELENKLSITFPGQIYMMNTSFLTFNGRGLPAGVGSGALEMHSTFTDLLKACDIAKSDEPQLIRMSEQIVLSVFFSKLGWFAEPLKEIDVFKDGKFVESSYYGASGGQFY